jgi:hypothetical protein
MRRWPHRDCADPVYHAGMKFFSRNPMKQLQANLAASQKRLALLAEKREAAKAVLDAAQNQRQKHLHEGDLDDAKVGEKLQGKVDTASSALAGLDDAISTLQAQIEVAERELKSGREREARTKAAEEINAAVDDVTARVEPALTALRELVQALSEIDHLTFEVAQLAQYIRGAAGEAELALAVALPDARHVANLVKTGQMAIPVRPQPAPVVAVEQPAPTQTVFMLKSAKYRDHDGRKRFAGQFEDVILPVATAEKAKRLGVAVPTTDPRRATHRGVRGADFRPDAADVIDLDAAEERSGIPFVGPDPVVRSANFQVIDRSAEARVISIPAGRAG